MGLQQICWLLCLVGGLQSVVGRSPMGDPFPLPPLPPRLDLPPPPPEPTEEPVPTSGWSYLITSSNRAYSGVPYEIAVDINNASDPVLLTAGVCVRNRHDPWTPNPWAPTPVSVEVPFPAGSSSTKVTLQIPTSLKPARWPQSYGLCLEASGGVTFNETKPLIIQSESPPVLIQMDKSTYKASQTVRYRVVCVTDRLLPYTGRLSSVVIRDPNRNQVQIERDLPLTMGVYTGSFELADLPAFGHWTVQVTTDLEQVERKTFIVDDYVLPKFEVTIDPGKFWLKESRTFGGKVKAMYTFGKPVAGTANVYLRRPYRRAGQNELSLLDLPLDAQGEATFTFTREQLFDKLGRYSTRVTVAADVTESLTDITLPASDQTVSLMNKQYKVSFPSGSVSNIKPGLPYRGFVEVSMADGSPIDRDMSVLLRSTHVMVVETVCWDKLFVRPRSRATRARRSVPSYPNSKSSCWPRLDYAKGEDAVLNVQPPGLAFISVPTRSEDTKMVLEASLVSDSSIRAVRNLNQMSSKSSEYMTLTLANPKLRPGSTARLRVEATEDIPFVHYQLSSRGRLVTKDYIPMTNRTGSISIPVTTEMTPTATVVAFYVRSSDGEIIMDSLVFNIQGLFENQVNVSYNTSQVEPGQSVSLRVAADNQSFVCLSAVDKSALLLGKGHSFGEEEVARKIGYQGSSSYGSPLYWHPRWLRGNNARDIFRGAGYLLTTDAVVHSGSRTLHSPAYSRAVESAGMPGPARLGMDRMAPMAMPAPINSRSDQSQSALAEPPTARTFFPETWLWTNATVGSDGVAEITATVPDSITSWVADAFAISPQSGLGVASESAQLEVSRPFFLTMSLPASIIRGEEAVILVNVFNYLSQPITVVVTLQGQPEFSSLITGGSLGKLAETTRDITHHEVALPGQGTAFYFPIVAKKAGFVTLDVQARSPLAADRVSRQLRVEPEGIPQEYFENLLINLGSGHDTQVVRLSLPPAPVLVPDSARIRVSIAGDILGEAGSLKKLIRLPTGCGEQNLGSLAPLVLVTEFLKLTGQLTPQMEEKARDYIVRGYQRQLHFQHYRGYFSVFPRSGASLRLTAFAIKTFRWVREYTYVDPQVLDKGLNWIVRQQAPDGSFFDSRPFRRSTWGPFTQRSVTSVADTAYVLISLLETGSVETRSVNVAVRGAIEKGLVYLERELNPDLTDSYVLSLIAYALQLARRSSSKIAYDQLSALATRRSYSSVYWSAPEPAGDFVPTFWRPPYRQGKAIEVETTSYALLTFLARNDRAALRLAGQSLTWLIKQRNPYGGFVSTQDTVVALQGMVQYATRVGTPSARVRVTSGNFTQAVAVHALNRRTLQTVELPIEAVDEGVRIDGNGHGVLTAQVIVDYHVTELETPPSFNLTVTVTNDTKRSFVLEVCSTYLLSGSSGMAMVEVGLPTGYQMDRGSMYKYPFITNVEPLYRQMALYVSSMNQNETLCFNAVMTRESMVFNSLPVPVSVYTYYEPAQRKTVFYKRNTKLQMCDVCENCSGCRPIVSLPSGHP